jgi:hypothetical protein
VTVAPATDRDVVAGEAVVPTVSAADARVAVASQEVQFQIGVDGVWQTYSSALTAVAGRSYRFRARATDAVGNTSAWSAPSGWQHARAAERTANADAPKSPAAPRVLPATPTTSPLLAPALSPKTTPTIVPTLSQTSRPTAKLTRTRWDRRKRTLSVAGRISGGQATAVVLRVRVKTSRTRTLRRRLPVNHGRFQGIIRLGRGVRSAHVAAIRVQGLR